MSTTRNLKGIDPSSSAQLRGPAADESKPTGETKAIDTAAREPALPPADAAKSISAPSAPEAQIVVKNGVNIYPMRPEWAPYMEADPKAYHGPYKAGGMNTPGDLPYVDAVEMSLPRTAVFEEVGLSNLEKLGVEPVFDQDVTITRADGSTCTINLARAADGSIPIDDFNLASEKILSTQTFPVRSEIAAGWGFPVEAGKATTRVTGAQILKVIDKLVEEAVRLGDAGQAHPIPRPTDGTRAEYLKVLRQFAVNNIWHSVGLTRLHQAAGRDVEKHPEFNEALGHDLVEPAPLRDLAWQMMKFRHEPWMDNWLRAEAERQIPGIMDGLSSEQMYAVMVNGPGRDKLVQKLRDENDPTNKAMAKMAKLAESDPLVQERIRRLGDRTLEYNPNAASPHYLVAMFEWGSSREDSNTLCHPHRDCDHHDGTSATIVNLLKRMANGAWHHAGVEAWPNVRHEYYLGFDGDGPKGSFQRFTGHVLVHDTAFRSDVVKKGSFEMAKFLRACMEAGYLPPAHKVATPEKAHFVDLNHAYGELQENNVEADKRWWALSAEVGKGVGGVSSELQTAARQIFWALDPVSRDIEKRFEQAVKAADMKNEAERKLIADLGQAAQARLIQLSASSVERTLLYCSTADRLSARVAELVPERVALKFLPTDHAIHMREKLEELPAAVQRSRDRGDATMAQYYMSWIQHLEGSFGSTQH